jgi:hypothetical protein
LIVRTISDDQGETNLKFQQSLSLEKELSAKIFITCATSKSEKEV